MNYCPGIVLFIDFNQNNIHASISVILVSYLLFMNSVRIPTLQKLVVYYKNAISVSDLKGTFNFANNPFNEMYQTCGDPLLHI